MEHSDPLRQLHDHLHVVLDDQDRQVLARCGAPAPSSHGSRPRSCRRSARRDIASFGSVASAMPISRLRCSPCDRLAASSSALPRRPTASSAAFGLLDDVAVGAVMGEHAPAMPARLRGDADVLEGGGVGQDVGDLIRAGDALARDPVGRQPGDVLAVEQDAPGRWGARRRSGN